MKKILMAIAAALALAGCSREDTRGLTVENDGIVTELTVHSPYIVRVVKHPAGRNFEKGSWSVVMRPDESTKVEVGVEGTCKTLQTSAMRIIIDTTTGRVAFFSTSGEPLLTETRASFEPCDRPADSLSIKASQGWKLSGDELIYGLGQRQDSSLVQRGVKALLWNHNGYISLPYFVSDKGYGVFWDNNGRTTFDDTGDETLMTSEVAQCSDYWFMYKDGTVDGTVSCLRDLSGDATMLPIWAHGYWQCRERYKSAKELAETFDRYRSLGVPVDVMVQDWKYWGTDTNWNAMAFINPEYIEEMTPEEMMAHVHDGGAHLAISIWPSFGANTKGYRELDSIGAMIPFHTWPLDGGVRPYDPFGQEARDIYWRNLKPLMDYGIDLLWTDATEPDHFYETEEDDDYVTAAGTWRGVKNAYSIATNRSIYENRRKEWPDRRAVQMTRSAAIGIQHYGTFSWSGDIEATWETMKQQIPSGLNYSICGIPYWNTDIGGFAYWMYGDQTPSNPWLQEMQVRWMQWGVYCPVMRNHCSSPMTDEIWLFGESGEWPYDEQKRAIEKRYELLPYIYSMAGEAALADGTLMRPIVMDFPSDSIGIRRNDEYMFGHSILVRPITDPMFTELPSGAQTGRYADGLDAASVKAGAKGEVSVWLPDGCDWYDPVHGNSLLEGGQEIVLDYGIGDFPAFIRAGSIMPKGPAVQYSTEKPWDRLEFDIYPGDDGKFVLYEDAGDGYGYEQGEYTTITFTWDDDLRKLTISPRKGSYPGMLKERQFVISLDGQRSTVNYKGRRITVTF